MDALQLLTADHNRVRGLAARFTAAHEADDHEAAATLAAGIMRELEVHTTIEEEVFYPAVRDDEPGSAGLAIILLTSACLPGSLV